MESVQAREEGPVFSSQSIENLPKHYQAMASSLPSSNASVEKGKPLGQALMGLASNLHWQGSRFPLRTKRMLLRIAARVENVNLGATPWYMRMAKG